MFLNCSPENEEEPLLMWETILVTGNAYLTTWHYACLPFSLPLNKLERNNKHIFSTYWEADLYSCSCHSPSIPYINHHCFWRDARTVWRNVYRTFQTRVSPHFWLYNPPIERAKPIGSYFLHRKSFPIPSTAFKNKQGNPQTHAQLLSWKGKQEIQSKRIRRIQICECYVRAWGDICFCSE